jgi:acyl-CoA thioester hydrolase
LSRETAVETTFAVRYAESDQMGIVHHASYVIWMEEGRSQYMRAKGVNYADIEREGMLLAVAELSVRYISPARYGDDVTVRTWIEEARSRGITFGYEIVNAASRATLVTGQVKLIAIDRQARVTRIPDRIQAVLRG